MRVASVFVFSLAIAAASACVTVSVGPITTPTASSSRAVSLGKGWGITWEDDGKTVAVDADTDLVRVALQDGYAWNVEVDSQYLQLTSYGPLQGANGFRAQVWLYKLLRTGETQIRAKGTPNCRSAQPPCVEVEHAFSVTLRAG